MNPSDVLGGHQSRRWRHPSEEFAKLLARTLLLQLDMIASSVFLETSIPNMPSITVPCTQDLRSRASQDTVQSEQRSLENGLIYRTGSLAKGAKQAHRSPRCSAEFVYSLSNRQRTRGYRLASTQCLQGPCCTRP